MGIINFSENLECALIELCKRKNIKNKLLEEKDVIRIFSGGPRCIYPLWIDMSLDSYDEKPIVKLKCSCRFRKSKELHNQDLGFPPFRIL